MHYFEIVHAYTHLQFYTSIGVRGIVMFSMHTRRLHTHAHVCTHLIGALNGTREELLAEFLLEAIDVLLLLLCLAVALLLQIPVLRKRSSRRHSRTISKQKREIMTEKYKEKCMHVHHP